MKFALYGLHRDSSADPDVQARRARLAEDAGFESLWVGDHLALPAGDAGQGHQRWEALITLAHLAAVTSRVRLASGVIVLPQRQPVLLAKQLASLDVLSKGRLMVGIGVGYIEPELRALGVSLAERAARTDEYLAVMRALWTAEPVSFAGRFTSFTDVVQQPGPVQRPHPPIIVGAQTPPSYPRAVRSGNGWYGWCLDPDQSARAIADLRALADRLDRPADLGELEISVTPPEPPDLATARRYAEIGVHRLVLQPSTADPAAMDDLITTVGDTLVGNA